MGQLFGFRNLPLNKLLKIFIVRSVMGPSKVMITIWGVSAARRPPGIPRPLGEQKQYGKTHFPSTGHGFTSSKDELLLLVFGAPGYGGRWVDEYGGTLGNVDEGLDGGARVTCGCEIGGFGGYGDSGARRVEL